MKTVEGKYATAKVFTENVEDMALEQVKTLVNNEITESSYVRFMPDIHAGKGCVIGTTIMAKTGEFSKICPNVVGVDIGCLDKDTEVMTKEGWIKISDWRSQEILEYNSLSWVAEFRKPLAYIKLPCDDFYYFKNSKGMNQMLSSEHRVLVYKGYKGRGYSVETLNAEDLVDKSLSKGYYNAKTTFRSGSKDIKIPDALIRLNVMISADGCMRKEYSEYNKVELHFTKQRKVNRAIELLRESSIPFKLYNSKTNNSVYITFNVPSEISKDLGKYFEASHRQLKIIAEECLKWDGHIGYRSHFYSTVRENADLVQYAFNATGTRASISISRDTKHTWKDVYVVTPTRNEYVGYCKPEKVASPDGFKYCFTTSTGYFVARRGGHIFLTGNCGILMQKVAVPENLNLAELDRVVNKNVPSGFSVHNEPKMAGWYLGLDDLTFKLVNKERVERSVGTLGGGNHYVELGISSEGDYWLSVHTGSRGLGSQVAQHHQKIADDYCLSAIDLGRERGIQHLKDANFEFLIEGYVKRVSEVKRSWNKDLSYLQNDKMLDYLHDMHIAQEYAFKNRYTILKAITREMGWEVLDEFDSVHNFVDHENGVIRKGATSARYGERLVIPLNMRDGAIIATGLGNIEWNYSAPHGAGRVMSRTQAKKEGNATDFMQDMLGIYSSSVGESTLDEAPFAYKPAQEIINGIAETAKIETIVKPIYNFKAH